MCGDIVATQSPVLVLVAHTTAYNVINDKHYCVLENLLLKFAANDQVILLDSHVDIGTSDSLVGFRDSLYTSGSFLK